MQIIRFFVIGFVLAALLAACTTTPGQPRSKVLCPACGTEFDALFEQRF